MFSSASKSSKDFREQGNRYFQLRKFIEALHCYNRALVTIQQDDPNRNEAAALCYANRSVVYLEMNYFDLCLHNIELAEESYPREKIQKLQERRQKCIELMKTKQDEATKLHGNPFKLSYPANPKLPFFIDALELKKDSNDKPKVITTRDLKAGDVIAVVDVSVSLPRYKGDGIISVCQNCMNFNQFDLKLFDGCNEGLFCSDKCYEEHMTFDHKTHETVNTIRTHSLRDRMTRSEFQTIEFHAFTAKMFLQFLDVFGSVDEMKKFVEEQRRMNYPIFDLDWSNTNDSHQTKNMFAVILHKFDRDEMNLYLGVPMCFIEILENYLRYKPEIEIMKLFSSNKQHRSFIDKILFALAMATHFVHPLSLVLRANDACGMYIEPTWQSLVNISCDPNITIQPFMGKQTVWMATRPIKAGDEILTAEADQYYYSDRPDASSCESETCVACPRRWRASINPIKVRAECNKSGDLYRKIEHWYELDNMLEQIKITAAFINANFDPHKYLKSPQLREEMAIKTEELRKLIKIISEQLCLMSIVNKMTWHNE